MSIFGKKALTMALSPATCYRGVVTSFVEKAHATGGGADATINLQVEGESFTRQVRLSCFVQEEKSLEADPNFSVIEKLQGAMESQEPVLFGYYMFAGHPRARVLPAQAEDNELMGWLVKQTQKQVEWRATKSKATTAIQTPATPVEAPVQATAPF